MLLQARNISYSISGNVLIQNLSIDIEEKQVISIIGYNGSGKSTLLKLLLGTISPTKGYITKTGGLRMGYVPQKLYFEDDLPLSVRDFVHIYNDAGNQTHDLSCSLLSIDAYWDKKLSGLSGGELQKVLIYNALLNNPQILLLDEPTSGLDVVAQKEFYELIDHIQKEHNISIIIVSHDLHTIYSKSDTVICIHKGICCTGSPQNKVFSHQVTDLLGGYVIPYLHTPNTSG